MFVRDKEALAYDPPLRSVSLGVVPLNDMRMLSRQSGTAGKAFLEALKRDIRRKRRHFVEDSALTPDSPDLFVPVECKGTSRARTYAQESIAS